MVFDLGTTADYCAPAGSHETRLAAATVFTLARAIGSA
jgi:hypothetical protein